MSVLGLRNVPRAALFIDGANLHSTVKASGFDIDYVNMLNLFRAETDMLRAAYYTAMPDEQDSMLRPLVDFLDYNGYRVITKFAREYMDSVTGRRRVVGNMDVELAVDAMEYCEHVDHIFLFSGNGNFGALIEALQRRGKRVTVVSALSGGLVRTNIVADDLRRRANDFINLNEDNAFTDYVHRRYKEDSRGSDDRGSDDRGSDDREIEQDEGVARTIGVRPRLERAS